ncbi:MvdC/MvdD family ATP grasp protein [Mesorhizobium sp. M0772]|uniref:MvdC/MvdD family ATP grasp protein n=1 Tax=Mesorhizobium sp. M0772 TaxID=2956998 RepID=UPI0033379839
METAGSSMTILILSEPADLHAHAVMEALRARRAKVVLLDLAEFSTRVALSMEFQNGELRYQLRRRSGGSLDLNDVSAVWWRRPQQFSMPSQMSRVHRQFALSEANTAFFGLGNLFPPGGSTSPSVTRWRLTNRIN